MLDDDCSPLVVLSTLYTLYMHNNSLCTEYTHRNKIPILVQSQYDTWDTSKLTVEDTHMRHPTQSSLIGVPGHLSHIIGQTRPSLISATAKATLHQAQSPSGKPKHITVQYGTCSPGRTLERSLSPWLLSVFLHLPRSPSPNSLSLSLSLSSSSSSLLSLSCSPLSITFS